MTIENKNFLIKLVIGFLMALFVLKASAEAPAYLKNPWWPDNIVKAKGTQRPKQVLSWMNEGKDISKDWKKIENINFSVSYPSCVRPHGVHEDYDDPKNSETVEFDAAVCLGFEKKKWNEAALDIIHNEQYKGSINGFNGGGPTLYIQSLKINDNKARMFVMPFADSATPKNDVKLTWTIYVECKNKTFQIIASASAGKESVDLINKGNYEFPEFFRKIVETFQCK